MNPHITACANVILLFYSFHYCDFTFPGLPAQANGSLPEHPEKPNNYLFIGKHQQRFWNALWVFKSLTSKFSFCCFHQSWAVIIWSYLILIKSLHWKTYLKPNFQFSSFNLAFPSSVIPLLQLCRGDVLLYPVSKKLSLFLSTGCVGDIWGSSFPYAKGYRHNMEYIGGKLTSKLRSSRAQSPELSLFHGKGQLQIFCMHEGQSQSKVNGSSTSALGKGAKATPSFSK